MRFASGILALVWFSVVTSSAAQPDRITAAIDSNQFVVLKASVHAKAQPSFDRGPVDPGMVLPYITMLMKPSALQQADLNRLLARQQNPSSSEYHKWLTPEQYAERFALSLHDMAQVSEWLKAQGFKVVQSARGRDWIAFTGTAAAVENTFHTAIDRFDVDGEEHFANTRDVSIPQALSGAVAGFRGLNDFRFKPMSHMKVSPINIFFPAIVRPFYTNGTRHFLAPGDLPIIYDSQFNSTGASLVVVGQVDVALGDIEAFRRIFELNANDPTILVVPGSPDPGQNSGDMVESDLDLEWSGAAAPFAQITFVTSDVSTGGVFNSASYAIDQALAPVISMSYGGCETPNASFIPSYEPTLQKANAEGITFVASTGDSGAAGCDDPSETAATQGLAVNYPASSPEVTAVGGTEFNEGSGNYWSDNNFSGFYSAMSYIPEKVWNDSAQDHNLVAGGGGKSSCSNAKCTAGFPKPSWQTGTGVPKDGVRDLPDVSLSASADHDGYLLCTQGSCASGFNTNVVVGGTSASAPIFAGFVASLNVFLGNHGSTGLGNINPQMYQVAQDPSKGAFHDITTGSNSVPCTQGKKDCPAQAPFEIGYSAGTGYDLATGLGSVDAALLSCYWTGKTCSYVISSVVPSEIDVGSTNPITFIANSDSTQLGGPTPTGTMTFFRDGQQIGTAPLDGNGNAQLNFDPSSLTAHNYAMTSSYGGDSTYAASTSSAVYLTVGSIASLSLSVSPTTVLSGSSDSVTLTATLTAANGTPTGTVSFHDGNTSLGQGTITGNTATLKLDASKMADGQHTISATYDGDTNFANTGSDAQYFSVQDYFVPLPIPSTLTVPKPGGGSSARLVVDPISGFNQPVTFSCSGMPSESTCSFNPASVTPNGSFVSTTLSITTTAPSASLKRPQASRGALFYALIVPGFLGVFISLGTFGRKRTRYALLGLLLTAGTVLLQSCGGGGSSSQTQKNTNPGTPAGTSIVTVTASTSGSNPLSHKVTFTLTVLQ